MPVYDDQDTRTRADEEEFRRVLGISPEEERRMEENAIHDGSTAEGKVDKKDGDATESSKEAEKSEAKSLEDRVGDTSSRLGEEDKASRGDNPTDEDKYSDSFFTGTGKKGIKTRIKNMSGRKKSALLGGTGGIIGLAMLFSGFFGLLNTFKLDFFLNNINIATFTRLNATFDRRSDKWLKAYLQLRLSEIDGSTQPGDSLIFRANRVDTNHPIRDWYRTLRTSNFEQRVFESQGIRFTSIAESDGNGGVRLRSAVIRLNGEQVAGFNASGSWSANQIRDGQMDTNLRNFINGNFITDSNSAHLSVFESDADARRAIKKVVNDETRFYQVLKRRHVRKDIANMTGVREWRFFEKTRSRVDDWQINFQQKLLRAVIPSSSRSGQFLSCMLALGPCPASTDPNSKENRTITGGQLEGDSRTPNGVESEVSDDGTRLTQTDSDGNVSNVPGSNSGDEALDLLNGAVSDAASEAGEDLAEMTPMAKIARRIATDIMGGSSGPRAVIKILDKIVGINRLFAEDPDGSSKMDKLVYAARATQAMAAFATLAIMADQIKSGEIGNMEEVGQAMTYMNGAENSEAWSMVTGQETNEVSDEEDRCDPEYEHEDMGYAPLCDSYKPDGGNRTSGIQDVWNRFISNSILGDIIGVYDDIRNSFVGRFLNSLADRLTEIIVGPLLAVTGLDRGIENVAGWLAGIVTKWVGVLPCMDGSENTGGIAMNCMVVGAAASAEAATRVSGGVLSVVGSEDYEYSNQIAADYLKGEDADRSFTEKYLALENTDSLASKGLFNLSTSSPGEFVASLNIGNLMSSISNGFSGILGGRTHAQTDLTEELGVKRYDIPKECFDLDPLDPDYLALATNADDEGHLQADELTVDILFSQDNFWDTIYDRIGADNEAAANRIYNCALLDKRVMGGLGNTSGYTDDDGLEDAAPGSANDMHSNRYITDCSGNSAIACTAIDQLLGIPYDVARRAAPDNPDPEFLDCSAFVGMALYRTFGTNVGGICSTDYLTNSNFQQVDVRSIQPGDFIGKGTGCNTAGGGGHIAIVVSYNPSSGELVTAETDGRSEPSRIVTTKGLAVDGDGTYIWAVRYTGPQGSPGGTP